MGMGIIPHYVYFKRLTVPGIGYLIHALPESQ